MEKKKRLLSVSKLMNEGKAAIMSSISTNKKPMLIGAAALAGLGIMSSGSTSDIPKGSIKSSSPESLQPIQSRKAFLRKNTSDGQRVNIKASRTNNRKDIRNSMDQAIFGNGIKDVRVNVSDRR